MVNRFDVIDNDGKLVYTGDSYSEAVAWLKQTGRGLFIEHMKYSSSENIALTRGD